jgi:DNA-binding response OmpR family regulator
MNQDFSSTKTGISLSGLRVLIVEDEPFIAMDISDAILSVGGTVVGPAMSVAEALKIVDRDEVQAAVLDVNLPDGNVGPVIEALREHEAVVIIHTGAGMPPDLAAKYPMIRVFAKPTLPRLLAAAIARQLRER